MYPPELSQEQADALDEAEQEKYRKMQAGGFRRHAASVPCVQAIGPLLPIINDPDEESKHHPLGWGHSRQ